MTAAAARVLLARGLLYAAIAAAAVAGAPAAPRAALAPAAGLPVALAAAAAPLLFLALACSGDRSDRSAALVWGGRVAFLGVVALAEEAIWRGVLLPLLLPHVSLAAAVGASAAAFALSHVPRQGRRAAVHLVTGGVFGGCWLAGGLAAAFVAHLVYDVLVEGAVRLDRRRGRPLERAP
jgi:membrane protease YdiL (CAAX protease family)